MAPMEVDMQNPGEWSTLHVTSWAREVGLAEETIRCLTDNEVDGPTLTTLSKTELQTELGIRSLPVRRCLWDLIERLKEELQTHDLSTALDAHSHEIDGLATNSSADAASGFHHGAVDVTVMNVLREDAALERQVLDDHLLALRLQNLTFPTQGSYEDHDLARKEQLHLDSVRIQACFDREYALSLGATRRTRADKEQEEQKIFDMCVDACNRNHIDPLVNEAETSQQEALRQFREVGLEGLDNQKVSTRIITNSATLATQTPFASMPGKSMANRPFKGDKTDHTTDLFIIDQCNACYDEGRQGFFFACHHHYCVGCTRTLFRTALKDSSLLPIVCCEIPVDISSIVSMLLKPDDAALIVSRTLEVTAKNKMYCPDCNQFINLDLVESTGGVKTLVCDCGSSLCIVCKTASHPRLTCEENEAGVKETESTLLNLARAEGWKQCPRCAYMIELRIGCNHMTCLHCRHGFCFKCLSPWSEGRGTCSTGSCQVWDEDRLLEAAEARIDNQAQPFVVPASVRQERLRVEMEALRGNEVCHHRWVRSSGSRGNCERCNYFLPMYAMVCQAGCRATVCYTCAHHRIPRMGWR